MRKHGDNARLVDEAGLEGVVIELLFEKLDGDLAVVVNIDGLIDYRHAADAYDLGYFVFVV